MGKRVGDYNLRKVLLEFVKLVLDNIDNFTA